MSQYRMRETAPESEPFAGLSIGKRLRSSAYGKFVDALADIESIIPAANFTLKLPRVVVVGERGVGKSSLMENFTKCPIFPRGKGTCTRMPVRLQVQRVDSAPEHVATIRYKDQPAINLKSTDEVLGVVQNIMNHAKGITSDEITVEIRQVIYCGILSCQIATRPQVAIAPVCLGSFYCHASQLLQSSFAVLRLPA